MKLDWNSATNQERLALIVSRNYPLTGSSVVLYERLLNAWDWLKHRPEASYCPSLHAIIWEIGDYLESGKRKWNIKSGCLHHRIGHEMELLSKQFYFLNPKVTSRKLAWIAPFQFHNDVIRFLIYNYIIESLNDLQEVPL